MSTVIRKRKVNRVLPLALVAVMLVGTGSTYAFLSDKESTQKVFTYGNVDVELSVEGSLVAEDTVITPQGDYTKDVIVTMMSTSSDAWIVVANEDPMYRESQAVGDTVNGTSDKNENKAKENAETVAKADAIAKARESDVSKLGESIFNIDSEVQNTTSNGIRYYGYSLSKGESQLVRDHYIAKDMTVGGTKEEVVIIEGPTLVSKKSNKYTYSAKAMATISGVTDLKTTVYAIQKCNSFPTLESAMDYVMEGHFQ